MVEKKILILKELKELYKKEIKQQEDTEKVEKDGFFLSKNLITNEKMKIEATLGDMTVDQEIEVGV